VIDDRPFIMMPFLEKGNAQKYIRDNPHCNRDKILHQISQGLVYLHSQGIVHGDLKAVNVLIDDGDNAVLCDFGLTRLKVDIIRRTSREDSGLVMGSRNWMAPERFCGGALREACDIYSFGMTIFEIHTNEVPLGLISPSDFINSVINQNVRPERPNLREAPQLSDTIWSLAQECWVKHPHMRPNIPTVCETLQSKLMSTTPSSPKPRHTSTQFPLYPTHTPPSRTYSDRRPSQLQPILPSPPPSVNLGINVGSPILSSSFSYDHQSPHSATSSSVWRSLRNKINTRFSDTQIHDEPSRYLLPSIRANPPTQGGTLDTLVDRLIKSSDSEPLIGLEVGVVVLIFLSAFRCGQGS
jgi:serine/threonine protein kinase